MPADVCIAVQEMRNNFYRFLFSVAAVIFRSHIKPIQWCTYVIQGVVSTNLMWKHCNSKKWNLHSWLIIALLWLGIKYRHLVHCQPMFCNLAVGCLASKSGLCKLCKLQWCIEMHSGPMNLKQACIHGRGGRWNNATTRRAISRLIPCQLILAHQPLQATRDLRNFQTDSLSSFLCETLLACSGWFCIKGCQDFLIIMVVATYSSSVNAFTEKSFPGFRDSFCCLGGRSLCSQHHHSEPISDNQPLL